MEQAIEKLVSFITITVHPRNTVHLDLSEAGVKLLLDDVALNSEKISKNLVVSLFNLKRQSDVESLVQNYQSVLIRLLDDLYKYQLLQEQNKSLIYLYSSTTDRLIDLLSFIETYFSKYFNLDERVPEIYYSLSCKELALSLGEVNLQLKGLVVDEKLVEIINSVFSFTNSEYNNSAITYRRLTYLKELLAELSSILSDANSDGINEMICKQLIQSNFNTPSFIVYVIDRLHAEVKTQDSLQDQILKLKFYKKDLGQIIISSSKYFHLDLMPAQEQLIDWIVEEIHFLESESQSLKQNLVDEQRDDDEFKINTSLSVPQLAYFVRLLVENKTITNVNQTQLLKFVASHFTTVKRENMSYGHLRSQYYKIEFSAIENIRTVLLTLINLTRKIK